MSELNLKYLTLDQLDQVTDVLEGLELEYLISVHVLPKVPIDLDKRVILLLTNGPKADHYRDLILFFHQILQDFFEDPEG